MPVFPAEITIKIAGTALAPEVLDDLIECIVDTNLQLPDMFTLALHDDTLKYVDDTKFEVGKEVVISTKAAAQGQRSGSEGVIFEGEITALEPEFDAEGRATMRIRGYDKSHRLHRGKKTRVFLKQKDSDVVKKLAQETGLSVSADATTVEYEYLLQNNQTNMEFLVSRAHRLGYHTHVAANKLYFKKSNSDYGDAPELEWGLDLLSFRPRLTTVHQSNKVEVRGWDSKQKEAIVGQASSPQNDKQGGFSKNGGSTAQSAFSGEAVLTVVGMPVVSASDAEKVAQGYLNLMESDFVQAEGSAFGDPRIVAGKNIKLKGLGSRFSGTYFITSATHIFTSQKYEVVFNTGSLNPATVNHLVGGGHGAEDVNGLFKGVVPAIVTNLNDPDGLGRVKVAFPWLPQDQGKNIESWWARIAAPSAGQDNKGFFYLPEVNDEVLVAFEHGNPQFPYILGALWNGKDKPPKQNSEVVADGKVKQRIIRSRTGHTIILDDTKDDEKITIMDKSEKNSIVISSKENSLTIRIEDPINIEAKGAISLKSTQGDVSIECNNFSVKAKQEFKAEANSGITMDSKASATYKANASAVLEGTAGVEVKNAGAKVALQGPKVDINNGALEVI